MKRVLDKLAGLFDVGRKEFLLMLLLSIIGWAYFAYMYIFETGLGNAMPVYAGF